MILLLALLAVGGYAIYCLTPEERKKLLRSLEARFWQAKDAIDKTRMEDAPFRTALRARTAWPVATAAVVALNAVVFVLMLGGSGSMSDPQTLVDWGASVGPRTTNGEWWRLATALLVHAGFIQLVVFTTAFAQPAITLERMLGTPAVATMYVSAGVFATLDSLSRHPMEVTAGLSAVVFGVYGLLLATLLWTALLGRSAAHPPLDNLREPGPMQSLGLRDLEPSADDRQETPAESPEPLGIPRSMLLRMIPAAAIFLLYNLASGIDTAHFAGLLTGFICGLVFARGASEARTPLVHVAGAAAVAVIVILGSATMLRGVADVRPEIARVVALEAETVGTYEKAVSQFKNGGLSAPALARVINQKIVPELRSAQARLKAVRGVPSEHQALVAGAEEYFKLRDESWRLRADALAKSNLVALRAADRSERASLQALDRIRPENK